MDVDIALDILPQDALRIKENYSDYLDVIMLEGAKTSFLQFNMTSSVLSDVRVRQAIAHLLDRQEMESRVLQGFGTVSAGHLWGMSLPSYLDYDNLVVWQFDPGRATELLNEAGYFLVYCEYSQSCCDFLQNCFGTWKNLDGEPMPALSLLTPTEDFLLIRKAQYIKETLTSFGIPVEMNFVTKTYFDGYLKVGNFDIALLNMFANDLYSLYQLYTQNGGLNHGDFHCEQIEYLFDKAFSTICPETSLILLHQIQYILSFHIPVLGLVNHPRFIGLDNATQGISFSVCGSIINLNGVRMVQ